MSKNRRWINFARYSSPPMAKGKVLNCLFMSHAEIPCLHLELEVNGIVYEGTLPVKVSEDEEE